MVLNSFPPAYGRVPTSPPEHEDSPDAQSRSSSRRSSPHRCLARTRHSRWAAAAAVLAISLLAVLSVPLANRPMSLQSGHALPLPPHRYFGSKNDTARPRRLWGPGLSEARQNVEATFYIDFTSTNDPPLQPESEDIAVWLEGPARFAADVEYTENGRYLVRYTALDAGDYSLRADVFGRTRVNEPYRYWQPLGLQAYNVTVLRQDGSRARGDGRQELALPTERCRGDEAGSLGRWVRCEDTPLTCTRYGWVWVPRDCMYHIYTPDELIKQDLWIAFVGTSVWRGIFFAGVDHLLGPLAANLSAPTSRFWKCWGRLSTEVGRLRISYLDFRQQCMTGHGVHCVGDYLADTKRMLGIMAQERGGRGPDMILWEANDNARLNESLPLHRHFDFLSLYRQRLGASWDGDFVAAFRTYSPEMPYSREKTVNLAAHASTLPEAKVEFLDMSVSLLHLFFCSH